MQPMSLARCAPKLWPTRGAALAAGAATATLATVALLASFAPATAQAQQYPNRPVRLLVGYAPGGSTDTAARVVGARLQTALGQAFVVENVPGANAILAHQRVVKAAPDGYTLIISSSADTVNATLNASKTGYKYPDDFTPIARLTQSTFFVLVNAQTPVKSIRDLLDYAKTHDVSYSSSGVGTPSHLGVELLFQSRNLKGLHAPYAGAGPATLAVLAGTTQLSFTNMSSGQAALKDQRVRVIAQSGKTRSRLAADIPTVTEQGVPDFDVVSWAGLDGPGGLPANIVKILADASLAALKDNGTLQNLATAGTESYAQDTAEYTAFLKNEINIWARVLKAANVKPE